jgi:hypothetical protein
MMTNLLEHIADARTEMVRRGARPESLVLMLGEKTFAQIGHDGAFDSRLLSYDRISRTVLGMPVQKMMDAEGFAVRSID